MDDRPKVGIGVLIIRGGKVLLCQRKGSHGEGEYAFPGGHLEYMESFSDCAKRETLEESGVIIENVHFLLLANVTKYKPKHYVHITVTADWVSGEPEIREPDKCASWGWYDLNNLPSPMFEMCKLSFDSLITGRNYYE